MVTTLFAFTAICIALVVYPYLIYPRILKWFSSKQITSNSSQVVSKTLVFCAYNEGASLPEKINNIERLKKRYPDLEVLAYDDQSSDETLALLRSRPDLLKVVEGVERKGKAFGMKLLAAQATGDVLIFTDANVLLDEDAIDNLIEYYADPSVGGVCGALRYIGSGKTTTAHVGSAYWRLEERIKSEESRTGSVMGADGSIFSIRRVLYPSFPDSVLDDMTVSMSVVFAGKRLLKVEDVVAYERIVADRNDEFSRKVRIATRAFHTHQFLKPKLREMNKFNKFKYISHKLLRWFGGGIFVFGALSFFIALFLLSIWIGAIFSILGVGAIVLGLTAKKGKLASVFEVILALLATQWGVIRAMRGQTQTIWNPAASR